LKAVPLAVKLELLREVLKADEPMRNAEAMANCSLFGVSAEGVERER